MAKELYIYTPIFDFTAEAFIASMEEAKAEDVVVRLYTPGGDPLVTWGMIAKTREHEEGVQIKVDGKADSAGAYFLLFHSETECLSTSEFLLHRAHFQFPEFATDASKERLVNMNKHLRAAMEAKLDIAEFEKIAGVTLDEFFGGDTVIDVNLNAKNAKKIGLVKKIRNLAPEQAQALGQKFAAYNQNKPGNPQPEPKKTTMTLDELKAQHPSVYNAIFNSGVVEGKKKETDRVQAWSAFIGIDAKAVAEGIKSGDDLSQAAIADFSVKGLETKQLEAIEAKNAEETETTEEGAAAGDAAAEAAAKAGDAGDGSVEDKAAAEAAAKGEGAEAKNTDDFEALVGKNMNLESYKKESK